MNVSNQKSRILIISTIIFSLIVIAVLFTALFRVWSGNHLMFYFSYLVLTVFPGISVAYYFSWYEECSVPIFGTSIFLIALHFHFFQSPNIWDVAASIYRGEYFLIPIFEFMQGLPAWVGIFLMVHHGLPLMNEFIIKKENGLKCNGKEKDFFFSNHETQNDNSNAYKQNKSNGNMFRLIGFAVFLLLYIPMVYIIAKRFFLTLG